MNVPQLIVPAILLAACVTATGALALDNNVHITGNLVTEPCSLSTASEQIALEFGNVVSKYFKTTERTWGMPFTIQLIDCDTSLGQSATVTFTGRESLALPGLLAPDGGAARGLAFGIETADDPAAGAVAQPVRLNQPSPVFTLSQNSTALRLQGYIRAEPGAAANGGIVLGPFTATATFEVAYP